MSMRQALTIVSWIGTIIGALSILGGLSKLTTDPTSAYYSLIGGVLFATQGIMSLLYIDNQNALGKKRKK